MAWKTKCQISNCTP